MVVDHAVGRAARAGAAAREHRPRTRARAWDLAVAVRRRRPRAARSVIARSSRISSGRTSRVPLGIGWITDRRAGWRARLATRSIRAPSVAQALVDALVAAVDLADVADLAAAVGAQRGDQHRHAGADVGRLEALAAQPARAR